MDTHIDTHRPMPDVSSRPCLEGEKGLARVGMTSIEMPIWVTEPKSGEKFRQPAQVDAFVSLDDPQIRGIHMSRLYLTLQDHLQSELISLPLLKKLLRQFIDSQKGSSESAFVSVQFDWPIQRESLLSGEYGWRQYPIEISAQMTPEKTQFFLSGDVTYSSTCPCSAALSQQLIQEQFLKDFGPSSSKDMGNDSKNNDPKDSDSKNSVSVDSVTNWLGKEGSIVATPHAQRSQAKFKLEVDETVSELVDFIDLVEDSLGTPVQTVVKRQDEQEFARLNGSQLMFCEDAARKIRQALEKDSRILDYWVKVEHLESLHPHNAVSLITKGVPGGFQV